MVLNTASKLLQLNQKEFFMTSKIMHFNQISILSPKFVNPAFFISINNGSIVFHLEKPKENPRSKGSSCT